MTLQRWYNAERYAADLRAAATAGFVAGAVGKFSLGFACGFVTALALVGFVMLASAAASGFHVTGRMDATDQEAQEGYFSVGRDVMIVTRPNSPIHDDLRSMVGSQVQVSVFVP